MYEEAQEAFREIVEQEAYEMRENLRELNDDEDVASIWGTIHAQKTELEQMVEEERNWKHYFDAKYGI